MRTHRYDSLNGVKFGIDADGNYGYYKAGADTVTPFRSISSITANIPTLNSGGSVTTGSSYKTMNLKKGLNLLVIATAVGGGYFHSTSISSNASILKISTNEGGTGENGTNGGKAYISYAYIQADDSSKTVTFGVDAGGSSYGSTGYVAFLFAI